MTALTQLQPPDNVVGVFCLIIKIFVSGMGLISYLSFVSAKPYPPVFGKVTFKNK